MPVLGSPLVLSLLVADSLTELLPEVSVSAVVVIGGLVSVGVLSLASSPVVVVPPALSLSVPVSVVVLSIGGQPASMNRVATVTV